MADYVGPISNHPGLNTGYAKRKTRELREEKQKQGVFNNQSVHGDQIYVLTDEDLRACLPPDFAQAYQRDAEMAARLQLYADPFTFSMETTPTEHILSIKKTQSGYATRRIARYGSNEADTEKIIRSLIANMKGELGWWPGREEEKELPVTASMGKGEVHKRQLSCPEHGDILVPGSPGVLKCPIEGCHRVARKKTRSSSPEVPVIEKAEDIKVPVPDPVMPPWPDPPLAEPSTPIRLVHYGPGAQDFALEQGLNRINLKGTYAEVKVVRDRNGLTECTVVLSVQPLP